MTPRTKEAASNLALMQQLDRRKQRWESDSKRRREQDVQANKMKRLRDETVKVARGDVVSIKVDIRDRAQHNSMGLVGVVVRVAKTGSGASMIATEHGVISTRGRTPTYLKYDQFEVKQKFTISKELRQLRMKVLVDDEFMPTECTTIKSAHQKHYGNALHTGRSKCGCKKGCRGTCSCRRNRRPCSSLCSCHGKCGNTLNFFNRQDLSTPLNNK